MAYHKWNDVRGKVAAELGPERLANARGVNQAYVDAFMLAEKLWRNTGLQAARGGKANSHHPAREAPRPSARSQLVQSLN